MDRGSCWGYYGTPNTPHCSNHLVLVSSLHIEGIHRVSVAMGQVTSEVTATTPHAALHLVIVKIVINL